MFRHICSSRPCQKSLAAPGMLRTTNGKLVSRESHPSEERSEPPPAIRRREYHCTLNLHRRNQPHHTVFRLSVDRSLHIRCKHLGRSWRQKPSCYAETERSAALTIHLSRNREEGLIDPFTLQRTFFCQTTSTASKKFQKKILLAFLRIKVMVCCTP